MNVTWGNISDTQLWHIYRDYADSISYIDEKTFSESKGDFGNFLADIVFQRAQRAGKTIEEWLKHFEAEKNIARGIYDIVSSQKVYMADAEILIESILRRNGHHTIPINGRDVPLSQAKNFIVNYARSLLSRNNLPIEPIDSRIV